MTNELDHLISDIQMLSLSLSTNRDPEQRRTTLIEIRDKSYQATAELMLHVMPVLRPIDITPQKPQFGIDDI